MKAKREWQFDFFMEVFSIAAWEIRKERNEKISGGSTPTFQAWLRALFSQLISKCTGSIMLAGMLFLLGFRP
jgi:hypothetical protein